MKVGVLGAAGFVGSAITQALEERGISFVSIRRSDDWALLQNAELIVHAANTGRRFWANSHPEDDFRESVLKTNHLRQQFPKTKIVLISSLSARTQLSTSYGRHRRACELLVENSENLVIRLGPMYGGSKQAGALYDILAHRPVYNSEQTRYAYVSVEYNARKIVDLLGKTGLIELGARDAISLSNLAKELKSQSVFQGEDDTQIPEHPQGDAPSALEVVKFAKELKEAHEARL